MRNKKPNQYSYNNHDTRERKFVNKNFSKTDNYHSNFSETLFQNTSFVGAKFKFCALYGARFENCLIRGALFRGCNLTAAVFKDSIISAAVFERCKLSGCTFENCKIVPTSKLKNLLPDISFPDTDFFDAYPSSEGFNHDLIEIVESLRSCDLIRQSTVLHRKKGMLDTVSLKVLVEEFGEEFLTQELRSLPALINNSFHTLSYINHILRKRKGCDKKGVPGPIAHGAPILTNECLSTD
ncbi:pentapeptide repeat-containing protein [Ralstonia chuxiongensis]|uniref:pentapeptide repeat-containing protein n=1 Tax=Ralstonia chuxiongensis TaxID=2957504 RepID=UPI00292CCF38|nr:pentapeptide repeat-containing protein [Ralstonia chuxiongensis]